MLEALLWWLFVAFIIAIVLGVVLYFVTRWLFMRTAEQDGAPSLIAASAARRLTHSLGWRNSRRRAASRSKRLTGCSA